MKKKKILSYFIGLSVVGLVAVGGYLSYILSDLPEIITVKDYKPLVVSKVYDIDGLEIGEFFREKRIIVPFEKIPKHLVEAFISAEDSSFFEHSGINLTAITRAMIANIKAGRKVQGGSTITQQVAKSLLLTPEKTYTRKIKEARLALQMEQNLSKEEIIFLYLNQIFLGQGYGVQAASENYFRKDVSEITIPEAAILAGLPQAPSRYSPIRHPQRAKKRQVYVLGRMKDEGFITEEQYKEFVEAPVKVYRMKNYKEIAPYMVETIRQYLVEEIGEKTVLDEGIKIYTGIRTKDQLAANEAIKSGLRVIDKRQGFRGPTQNLQDPEKIMEFLKITRKTAIRNKKEYLVILADGSTEKEPDFLLDREKEDPKEPNLPSYYSINDLTKGIVTKVDDKWGLVYVRFSENEGIITFDSMKWARKPDPTIRSWQGEIKKPSEALSLGDVVQIRIANDKFRYNEVDKKLQDLKKKQKENYERPEDLPEFDKYVQVTLEQEPVIEAGLISFDINTHDIVAMVGGYDFKRSQFNRTIQAARQTGSSFKSIVFASALDKGYTPATTIVDSPIVYEETVVTENDEGETIEETRKWKPHNYSEKFSGDILFRKALIKSMNIPTVKILDEVGVDWVAEYSRRLGIFSPLNLDLSLGLGSSSLTLYEITKVFATFGKNGLRIRPRMLYRVEDTNGEILLEDTSLDNRFKDEIAQLDLEFEEKRQAHFDAIKAEEEAKLQAEANGEFSNSQEPESNLGEELELSEDEKRQKLLADLKKQKSPNFYFENEEQLVDPRTAYLTTTLLKAVVDEGTGRRSRALGRPTAAKTGTTNGFFDAWFVGYTANIATGVWVGFDNEKSLGKSESGGLAAQPIWLEFMKIAHENLPVKSFPVPEGIVFANIDADTGSLGSAQSNSVVRQAFRGGTEPRQSASTIDSEDEKELLKEDLVN